MRNKLFLILMCCTLNLVGCSNNITDNTVVESNNIEASENISNEVEVSDDISNEAESREVIFNDIVIPAYSEFAYIHINDNEPMFTDEEKLSIEPFETFTELDELGRCGVAYANVCTELMPTDDRGAIGQVKPSGWHTVKYDIVDGKYLYNRCHLIGFQLTGENANEKNLITGTRYLNIDGMLEHENMVAEYVKETKNHVLYRVTPVYFEDNLVADGVIMEAYSVEDKGEGLQFCIFAYNVQPGIQIDYLTGQSKLIDSDMEFEDTSVLKNYTENPEGIVYIVNIETKKFHYEDCGMAIKTKDENKESYNGTVDWLLDNGYKPCGKCKPQ